MKQRESLVWILGQTPKTSHRINSFPWRWGGGSFACWPWACVHGQAHLPYWPWSVGTAFSSPQWAEQKITKVPTDHILPRGGQRLMGFPEFELFIVWGENLPWAPLALPPSFSPWNFPDPLSVCPSRQLLTPWLSRGFGQALPLVFPVSGSSGWLPVMTSSIGL